jgi:hypothetical protein
MADQGRTSGSTSPEPRRLRNWSLIVGRVLLVWALLEAGMSGLAELSGGSLLGVDAQHFALDGIIAALAGIGFVIDGSVRRLTRDR